MNCGESHVCHDKWRASECLPGRCNRERPCLNGGTCRDHAENGVVFYKCECRRQFHGIHCESGSAIIVPQDVPDTIDVKLVVGKCN